MEETQGRVGADSADAAPEVTEFDVEESGEESSPQLDPSLMEEASALIDNARTYAEAELGFQKTRAAFAGRLIGVSLGLVVVALILLHIAFLALAVGLVLAFEPVVGIWGAIGIVFGGLMLVVALLGWGAFSRAQKLATLFTSSDEEDAT
ncbi:phage holin family protein [uncultured Erythrobacter sp.]|uniref:phage holin family protein n=1 Tax=uncultured Erythrobacter sp. TaxID=263913 RepID=UPI00260177D4|nr:phage holin family protein [uncultured Erythrobacter sp.]